VALDDAVRELGTKLGPVLMQLGPDFGLGELPGLAEFLPHVPRDIRLAVEFRQRGWINEGVLALLVGLLCMQAKLGVVPFDIAEAEQEIMAGPLIEYSGALLALFRLSRAMMYLLLPVFLITMFWGGVANWWAVPKFLLLFVLMVLMKNTNPRLRIDQALKFFWLIVTPVAIAAVVLALLGL
jgi:NADH:ubiquinone oxidoreductase subunit H